MSIKVTVTVDLSFDLFIAVAKTQNFLAIVPGTFCNSSTRAESGFLGCMFETNEVFFPGKMKPFSVLHSSFESIRSCFFTVSGWMGRTVAELYRGQ